MEKKLYYAEFIGIEESKGQVSQIFGGLISKSDRVTQAVSYKEARRNIAYRVDQKLHCGQNNVYVLFGPYPEKDGKTVVPNDVAEYNRTTNITLWQKTALFICDDEPIFFDQRTIDFLDRLIAIANTACDWHYDYWKNKHDDWDDDPYYNEKEWGYRLSFKVDGTEYELEERNSEGSLRGLCLGGYDLPLIDGIVHDIRQDKSLLKPFLIVCRDLLKKRLGYTEINQSAAEAAATNPVPDFMTAVDNLNEEEAEIMEIKTLYKDVDWTDRKAVRKISNQVLSMIIDKKTNEEKHLFSKVFNILYDSGAYMDIAEEDNKVTVFFGDSGIVIPAKSAIEFAREIYIEVQDPEWVSTRNAQAIRTRLADLFKQNKVSENTAENKKEEGNMNKIIVTGIGSREIDEIGKTRIAEIAKMMDAKGFILRSGGADGADSIFEANMNNKEVYLPWKGFNGNSSALYQLKPECFSIARSVHPAWNKLSSGAQKLHARNVYQVLGYDLNMPSSICVCWTKDGIKTEAESSIATGGSRTAIVLADRNHIPVFNLKLDADYEELKRILASDTIPFKEAVVKQETTKTQQSETVENKPAVNNAAESAAEKEENKMNDVQGRETQVVNPYDEMVSPGREPDRTVDLKVFAMYNGKKGYVNRTTTFWTKEPEFYVGNVFKNGIKVGSWTWNLEFKYPQYKPIAGSLGGDGTSAFNYAYPSDMKKMVTNEERVNRTNCNGYLVAITVALAKVGIKTKYQPKQSYGAAVMDSSGPAPRTVTGRTHKKPEEPVIVNTGIDENDLAFYE